MDLSKLSQDYQELVNAILSTPTGYNIIGQQPEQAEDKAIVAAYIIKNTKYRTAIHDIIEYKDELPSGSDAEATVYLACSLANILPSEVYKNLDNLNLNDLGTLFNPPRASDKSNFISGSKERINETKGTNPTLAYILTGNEQLNSASEAPKQAEQQPTVPAASAAPAEVANNDKSEKKKATKKANDTVVEPAPEQPAADIEANPSTPASDDTDDVFGEDLIDDTTTQTPTETVSEPATPAEPVSQENPNQAQLDEIFNKINALQKPANKPVFDVLSNQAASLYQSGDLNTLNKLYSKLVGLTATEQPDQTTVQAPTAEPTATKDTPAAPAEPVVPTTAATPTNIGTGNVDEPITEQPAPQRATPSRNVPPPTNQSKEEEQVDNPETTVQNVETDYPNVVDFIRRSQMSQQQGDDLIEMINDALNDPVGEPESTELASAVRNFGPSSVALIYDKLDQLDPTRGHKVAPYKQTRNLKFARPSMMQSSKIRSTNTGLVTPTGFGTSINSNIWNKPVITEFGFPFLNVSSDAISHLFKSKGEAQQAAFKKFKKMLKEAVKTYGGIWKAIYKASLDVLKQYASDPGVRCVANMLKVDGEDLLSADLDSTVTVTPINYYSVDTSYNSPTPVPRDYLTTFYDVLDYTKADRSTYLQYADGLTANEFSEEIERNNGIPPFYILVPKKCGFSKCEMKPTGVFGSFINLFSSSKNCVMVKTFFNKRKGCFLMEKRIADALYADIQ